MRFCDVCSHDESKNNDTGNDSNENDGNSDKFNKDDNKTNENGNSITQDQTVATANTGNDVETEKEK